MSSLPPPPPGPAPRSGGTRRWLVLGAVAVVLVLVVGVVAALSFGRDGDDAADPRPSEPTGSASDDQAGGDPDEGPGDDPTDEPAAPTQELTRAQLFGSETFGPICEGTAVVTDAEPFPAQPQQLGDLVVQIVWGVPELDPPPQQAWVTGAGPTEVIPPTDLAGLNAVVCVLPVPGTTQLRYTCEDGTRADGTRGTWDVYSSDYEILTLDPTTGEVVREPEEFSSLDLPDYGAACDAGPISVLGDPPSVTSDFTLPGSASLGGPYVEELVAP